VPLFGLSYLLQVLSDGIAAFLQKKKKRLEHRKKALILQKNVAQNGFF